MLFLPSFKLTTKKKKTIRQRMTASDTMIMLILGLLLCLGTNCLTNAFLINTNPLPSASKIKTLLLHCHYDSTTKASLVSSSATVLFAVSEQDDANKQQQFEQQAQELLAKAKQLRTEIGDRQHDSTVEATTITSTNSSQKRTSEWSVVSSDPTLLLQEYRLYIDIGREEGTWMDPRWGASGRRIEFTCDIGFTSTTTTDSTIVDQMVQDNRSGRSSPTFILETAKKARLDGGFDKMDVRPGAYRIDFSSDAAAATIRFFVTAVDGTQKGDISIPKGNLYFSLPCFFPTSSSSSSLSSSPSSSSMILSTKEGIVSVRQVGWHTGWRRQESRIVGVFRAVPIDKAKRLDGF